LFADFNFKDMDRVRTFYRIAKENGRRLVVKLKDCYYYYLKYMSQDGKRQTGRPKLRRQGHRDIQQAKAGLWHLRRRRLFYGENVTFASLPNAKTAAEISENPNRYLCALGYFSFASLIDIKPLAGSLSTFTLQASRTTRK
jgi:hypothetical protein